MAQTMITWSRSMEELGQLLVNEANSLGEQMEVDGEIHATSSTCNKLSEMIKRTVKVAMTANDKTKWLLQTAKKFGENERDCPYPSQINRSTHPALNCADCPANISTVALQRRNTWCNSCPTGWSQSYQKRQPPQQ